MVLPVNFAGTVVSAAAASIISGEGFDHGDAVCLVDERYDSSFHRFILHSFLSFLSFHSFLFICCIIWLLVMFRTLRLAAMWAPAMAVRFWAGERGFMVRAGQHFQLLVVWP